MTISANAGLAVLAITVALFGLWLLLEWLWPEPRFRFPKPKNPPRCALWKWQLSVLLAVGVRW